MSALSPSSLFMVLTFGCALAQSSRGAVCGNEYKPGCLVGTSTKNITHPTNCCLQCAEDGSCDGVNLHGDGTCEFLVNVTGSDASGNCQSQMHPGPPTPAPFPTPPPAPDTPAPTPQSLKLCVTDPKTFSAHWINCCTDHQGTGGCTFVNATGTGTHSAVVNTWGHTTMVKLSYPNASTWVQLPFWLSDHQPVQGALILNEQVVNWTACTANVPDEKCW